MKTRLEMRYELRVVDAITNSVKRIRRGHNTVLDAGLTSLANARGTAGLFTNLCVGTSATENYIPGGALTFTQVLTTITASAPFFTAGMVGGIFKFGHGTAGLEAYIQSIGGGGTTAVVDISRTVGVPDAGTVWLVNQTQLVAFSYNYDAYVPGATNCKTTQTYAGGICTVAHLRTFIINQKISPYTVNELGWGHTFDANPVINGRVVLGAPEVIGVNDYLVVAVTLTYTIVPPVPVVSAAGDQIWNQYKGTGTFAGVFALEIWATQTVNSSGGVTQDIAFIDSNGSGNSPCLFLATGAGFAQNAHIGATPPTAVAGYSQQITANWAQVGGAYPGVSRLSVNYTFTTAGETLYAIGLAAAASSWDRRPFMDMVPNWSGGVPATLPVGSFPVTTVWQNIWTRPLNNP